MDEPEYIAAEKALGHEPVGASAPGDDALRAAWERRLAPLLDISGEAPPPGLFRRIEEEIDRIEAPSPLAEIVPLRRSLARWRAATGIALAAAAALALYVAAPQTAPPKRYVAMVTAEGDAGAGLIVDIDIDSGVATVIPVATAPEGHSYEMWTVPEGAASPVSLGLLPQEAALREGLRAEPGQLFAVSLEPEGGSPDGKPSQVVFQGRLTSVE